jgi:hypothetical protein
MLPGLLSGRKTPIAGDNRDLARSITHNAEAGHSGQMPPSSVKISSLASPRIWALLAWRFPRLRRELNAHQSHQAVLFLQQHLPLEGRQRIALLGQRVLHVQCLL